jgi:hypothetical protein
VLRIGEQADGQLTETRRSARDQLDQQLRRPPACHAVEKGLRESLRICPEPRPTETFGETKHRIDGVRLVERIMLKGSEIKLLEGSRLVVATGTRPVTFLSLSGHQSY